MICIIFFHILIQQTFKILNLFWKILKNSLFHLSLISLPLEMFNSFEIFMTVSMTTALFLMTRSTLTLALTSEMYGPSTRNTLADSAGQHGNNGQLCCSELQQQEISIELKSAYLPHPTYPCEKSDNKMFTNTLNTGFYVLCLISPVLNSPM